MVVGAAADVVGAAAAVVGVSPAPDVVVSSASSSSPQAVTARTIAKSRIHHGSFLIASPPEISASLKPRLFGISAAAGTDSRMLVRPLGDGTRPCSVRPRLKRSRVIGMARPPEGGFRTAWTPLAITLDAYPHAVPAMQEDAAELIAGLVLGPDRRLP
jgi:hypothetical protein